MQTSDFIASLALVVSGGALALQVKQWFDKGPRLHLSLIADGVEVPHDDGKAKLFITVINRGDSPTTITHMICYAAHPRWQMWRQRRFWRRSYIMTAVVNTSYNRLPSEVCVNKYWMDRLNYDDALSEYRRNGQLYVGVIASHSNKIYLVRVPRAKIVIPTDVVGGE